MIKTLNFTYTIILRIVLPSVLVSCFVITSHAQSVGLNFSGGYSSVFSDKKMGGDLLKSTSLSVLSGKSNYSFIYSNQQFIHTATVYETSEDLMDNYISDVNSFALSYQHTLLTESIFQLFVGVVGGFSTLSLSTNVLDLNDRPYQVSNGQLLSFEGNQVQLDSDYETNLLTINQNQLINDFYFVAPSIRFAFNVTPDLDLSFSSAYRFNSTDLIDYSSPVNNTSNDHQLDLLIGLSFNLFNKNNEDSIPVIILEEVKEVEEIERSEQQSKFRLNTSLLLDAPYNEELQDGSNIEMTQEIIVENEATNQRSEIEKGSNIVDFHKDESVEGVSYNQAPESNLVHEEETVSLSHVFLEDQKLGDYYLIAGVFADLSNLKKYASKLMIDENQVIKRNSLNYLYLAKSDLKLDLVQLKGGYSIDCWIYHDSLSE